MIYTNAAWIKMILLQWRNISYQTKTDLPAEEVTDDDMIEIQKEQRIKMILLVWSEEHYNKLNVSYQRDTDLQALEVADDDNDMI